MPKNPMYVGQLINVNDTNDLYIPQVLHSATPVAKAANATLTTTEASGLITNTGASGTIVLTLPKAADMKGKCLKVWVAVAQIVRLTPATGEAVWLGGSGVVNKYLNIAGVIGNTADLYCDGSKWIVSNYSGVLTKEA